MSSADRMFADGKRHVLRNVALCGAKATFPDRADAEDCEPCGAALVAIPVTPPEPRIVTGTQIFQAWHGTTEPWGGCADRAAVARVMSLLTGEDYTSDL